MGSLSIKLSVWEQGDSACVLARGKGEGWERDGDGVAFSPGESSDNVMKSVLITGGLGYIGSQLALGLASKYPSARVTVLDLPGRSPPSVDELKAHSNIQIFRGDVRSVDLVRLLLERVGCDCVVHLAAITECTTNNLLEFTRVNTIGTHILLEVRCSSIYREGEPH